MVSFVSELGFNFLQVESGLADTFDQGISFQTLLLLETDQFLDFLPDAVDLLVGGFDALVDPSQVVFCFQHFPFCYSFGFSGLVEDGGPSFDFDFGCVSVGRCLLHDREQVGQSLGSVQLSFENGLTSNILASDFVAVAFRPGGLVGGNLDGSVVGDFAVVAGGEVTGRVSIRGVIVVGVDGGGN